MERIGSEVKRELSRFGAQGAMPEVVEAWPEAVGPMVAANAWPARIARDGTLHVNTSSSAWAFELGQLAPEIQAKLAEKLGEKAPNSLRFAVGHLPEADSPAPAGARTATPEPTEEALQTAAALAAEIEDEELRERVQRAAALGLSKPPSDHPF
jgi:predicted nucleic acid-binding Zn ribbon protein